MHTSSYCMTEKNEFGDNIYDGKNISREVDMKKISNFFKPYCVVLLLLSLINVSAYAEERLLVPVGRTIGVTVNIKGVSVINTAGFEEEGGGSCSPAAEAGISGGDTILKINGKEVTSVKTLEKLTDGENEVAVVYEHNGKEIQTTVKPKKDVSDGKYRIGVWIKDSASGIGTMTYYDPNTGNFGALGHGICDSNGSLINISGGNALEAEITSIRRGEKGAPGELIGVFSEGNNKIGSIDKNTDEGIFGRLNRDKLESDKAISVAERDEVHEGDASVMCNVEGDDVCEYSVSIIKINDDENSSKGMIVKVTDPRLIEKTGGIVQGMSGSPLIQDGKFVGAITHVFVNNPTRGYAVFMDKMTSAAS